MSPVGEEDGDFDESFGASPSDSGGAAAKDEQHQKLLHFLSSLNMGEHIEARESNGWPTAGALNNAPDDELLTVFKQNHFVKLRRALQGMEFFDDDYLDYGGGGDGGAGGGYDDDVPVLDSGGGAVPPPCPAEQAARSRPRRSSRTRRRSRRR